MKDGRWVNLAGQLVGQRHDNRIAMNVSLDQRFGSAPDRGGAFRQLRQGWGRWSGVGTTLSVAASWIFQGQNLDAPAIAGIALIVMGVVIMNAFTKAASVQLNHRSIGHEWPGDPLISDHEETRSNSAGDQVVLRPDEARRLGKLLHWIVPPPRAPRAGIRSRRPTVRSYGVGHFYPGATIR